MVYNNTSGSQSIVVKTSAGTGITIPNGKRRAIYADATNVVDYINDLPSTVTFAGTFLPVAQGGTGGTTAAAARSALGAAASGANSDITSLTGLTTPLSIAQGGTAGAVSPVAGSVSYGTGSAYAFTAAGTVGQVLTSNGASAPTWTTDAAGTTIPSGTVMLFAQTNAPTGFTKITAHNNKALRLVSGTASSGGSIAFTTAFGSQNVGSTTLSTSQIPAHTHTYTGAAGASAFPAGESSTASAIPSSLDTGSTGGGSSHTHTLDISVSYVDVILASKD
ncbi:MAG: hypothetical protein JW395_1581 [Nitrospira sp.]|nr:hypothetical protein [Nitrospira sp.]